MYKKADDKRVKMLKKRYAKRIAKEKLIKQRNEKKFPQNAYYAGSMKNVCRTQSADESSCDDTATAYAVRKTEYIGDRSREIRSQALRKQIKEGGKYHRQRKSKAQIFSVLQENKSFKAGYQKTNLSASGLYRGNSGVKRISSAKKLRFIGKTGKAGMKILIGAVSFIFCIIAVIVPLSTAAAFFGNESEAEAMSEYDAVMANAVCAIAKSQLGNEGGEKYWKWYGFEEKTQWCACFVSWCFNEAAKAENAEDIPKFAVCDDGIQWFIEQEQWYGSSIKPNAGMVIFFDWDGDGVSEHTGIVVKYENGVVYTVEGNSNDVCRQKQYAQGDKVIMGYGMPGR